MASTEKPRVKTVKSYRSSDTIRFISEARKTLDAYGEEESIEMLVNVPQHKAALVYAKERGVRLRYITNITKNNLQLCKELMKYGEVRHLEGIKGSGAISENECVITVIQKKATHALNKKRKANDGQFHRRHIIQSEQVEMVEHQQYLFEVLWESAIPAKNRILALASGTNPIFTEIIHNRESAENLLISAIKSAKSEVLIALNSIRYLAHLASLGVIDRMEQANSAGASVLVLCPNLPPHSDIAVSNDTGINQIDYEESLKLLSDIQRYAEIRNLAGGLTGTVVIIDNRLAIAMSEEGIEAAALYSNDRTIVNNFVSLFSALWTENELFRSLMRAKNELSKSNKSLLEANEQLKNHEAMQSEFINIAAHELRTPVQPILGMADLLATRLKDVRATEISIAGEELELIIRNAQRLERLSSDLLEVSRIESNTFKLQTKLTIDLEDKLRQLLHDMQVSILSTKPDLKLLMISNTSTSDPIKVDADVSRLSEALFNIIGNAVKFTDQGEITITTEKLDNMAVVRVTDTGTGIDSDVMPRLFTKFAPKSQSGSGLGLFITKNIIEAHGGRIWAENNSSGKGATFTFTLPLSQGRTVV